MSTMKSAGKAVFAFASSVCAMIADVTDAMNQARAESARLSGTHW